MSMKMTAREIVELKWLAGRYSAVWGGHLQRGQPLNDPQMKRWLELGLIEQVGIEGYRISAAGRAAIQQEK